MSDHALKKSVSEIAREGEYFVLRVGAEGEPSVLVNSASVAFVDAVANVSSASTQSLALQLAKLVKPAGA